jgi:hypothetical protein
MNSSRLLPQAQSLGSKVQNMQITATVNWRTRQEGKMLLACCSDAWRRGAELAARTRAASQCGRRAGNTGVMASLVTGCCSCIWQAMQRQCSRPGRGRNEAIASPMGVWGMASGPSDLVRPARSRGDHLQQVAVAGWPSSS